MALHDKDYGLVVREQQEDATKFWFDLKRQKFLHCVDTLYFTVDFHNDWMYDGNVSNFLNYLDRCKARSYEENDTIVLDKLDNMYVLDGGMSFAKIYYYCIQSTDRYWVFVAKGKPGKKTPAMLVQLRSQFLWLHGEKKACELALQEMNEYIFRKYALEVKQVKENRIDYAYHTNYIQAPDRFFDLKKLNSMQVSRFKQGRMIFEFEGDNDIGIDYVGFGVREASSVFVRMYNKTKEVVENGYKQFFLKCWLLNGLISRYDFYCLEKCFMKRSYEYMARARLEWYIEFAKDGDKKEQAREYVNHYEKYERDDVEAFANALVPKVTIIFNFEYQCKREFFSGLQFLHDMTIYEKSASSLLQVIKMKQLIHNYLTQHMLRFVDPDLKGYKRKREKPVSPFWARLQKMKLDAPLVGDQVEMVREYQRNIDKERVKRLAISNVMTFSLYNNNLNTSNFQSDVIDYLSYLNENDLQDYKFKKEKRAKQVSSKLAGLHSKNRSTDKSYEIFEKVVIDCSTGEILQIPTGDVISLKS